jgi:hypothetical protein
MKNFLLFVIITLITALVLSTVTGCGENTSTNFTLEEKDFLKNYTEVDLTKIPIEVKGGGGKAQIVQAILEFFFQHTLETFFKTPQGQEIVNGMWPFILYWGYWGLMFSIPAAVAIIIIKIANSSLPTVNNSQKGIALLLYFYLIFYWIGSVWSIFEDPFLYVDYFIEGSMTEEEIYALTGRWTIAVSIIALISFIGLYGFVFWVWSQIPKDIARITPKKAAWFTLIPFFNFYGWFVVFYGLLADMNKTAQRYGHPKFASPLFAVITCVLWIMSILICILFEPHGDVRIFLTFVDLILTTAFFIYLYRTTVKLLTIMPADNQANILLLLENSS